MEVGEVELEQALRHLRQGGVAGTALCLATQDDLDHLRDDRKLILTTHSVGDMNFDNSILAERANAALAARAAYDAKFGQIIWQGLGTQEFLAFLGIGIR